MIILQVAGYCQNCQEFEPRVTKDGLDCSTFDMRSRSYVGSIICNTTITCEHAARCQSIREYVQKEIKEEK